ncbi:N-acetyltransferase 9-like protein [Halotydeus destructor]|nr:N-acetyltransferase 9-like protein [Halotydeus destructor]
MIVSDFAKNRRIDGDKVALVPYDPVHVPKYHQWMKDPELQYLTASEPLSLEEEFSMQKSWVADPLKCTFIVLDKAVTNSEQGVEAMIGDTNLYLHSFDENECEIEVMIAEKAKRGCGRGKETILLMMRFGVDVIGIKKFIAKIKYDNSQSIKLFEKLGFKEESRSDVFQETTFIYDIFNENNLNKIILQTEHIQYQLLNKT